MLRNAKQVTVVWVLFDKPSRCVNVVTLSQQRSKKSQRNEQFTIAFFLADEGCSATIVL